MAMLQGQRVDKMRKKPGAGLFAAFRGLRFEQSTFGILLALPLLVVLVGLLLYPILSAIVVSFQSKTIGSPGHFIGLGNYIELLTKDQAVPEVFLNTVIYTVCSVAVKVVIGFVVAVILNERLAARNLFRGWTVLPWIIPTLVVGLTWRWMYDQTGGVINFVLYKLNLISMPPAWLSEKLTARIGIIIANVWRGFPFFSMTILAGLQAISQELYEAAEMDGASVMQRLRFVTVPCVRPIILVTVILSTIWTFNDFELLWVLTEGGPSYSTHIFTTYAFFLGFRGSRFGYATAASLIALPLIVLFIIFLVPKLWGDD